MLPVNIHDAVYQTCISSIPLVNTPLQHTWGVAQAWFLPDYTNYSNAQFDLARAQQANGFVKVRLCMCDCGRHI
jgi:hypothetical protein